MSKIRLALTLTVDYDLNGDAPDTLKERLLALVDYAVANGELTGSGEAEVDSWSAKVYDGKSALVTEHHITEGGTGLVAEPDFPGDVNDPQTIALWLHGLPHGASVHIDDDGLRLVQTGAEELHWLEIGGHTPSHKPLTEDIFLAELDSRFGANVQYPEDAFRDVCFANDGTEWQRLERARNSDDGIRCKLELEDKCAFRQGLNDYADGMVKDNQWVTFDNGSTYYTADQIKEAIGVFDESEWEYEPELRDKVDRWL